MHAIIAAPQTLRYLSGWYNSVQRQGGFEPNSRSFRDNLRANGKWYCDTMKWFDSPDDIDGLGQSWLTEMRQYWRFVRCRRLTVIWRSGSNTINNETPFLRDILRFGDETIATTCVAGRQWIVRERDFFGWPDPPRFVFFALEEDRIWAAADFHKWPPTWQYDTQDA